MFSPSTITMKVLLAVKKVFDHDSGACIAERMAFEHHVDSVMGFLFRHGDDDALAGGQDRRP